jgi:DNA-binding CsgD family transcriptional regulator
MIRSVRPDGTIETGGVFVPVIRRRVIDRIASAALQRIVLIVAPAGYGKSVAMRQYLEVIDAPWVRFDVLPENAALLGFLRGLADALGEVAPDARATLAGAYEKNAASQTPGIDLALWMHSHLKSFRGVIAIDDLHIAQHDRDVTQFLASLIERTKGRIQWVIASRATLGLPIGTWLAYGESDLAIDEHDLKFTVEEAKDAARSFRLGVRDEELYELLHLTDGWPTAMSFALRSSTRSIDLRSISSMTRDMIYRYLAEQVYNGLAEEERNFIETAALVPEFDVSFMAAAGYDQAASMIEQLRARVAFVHEKDPGVFRLHDLFGDFVRYQFRLRGEASVRQRSEAVARVLESQGRIDLALRLYADAGAAERLHELLVSRGIDLISRGHADDIDVALRALPEQESARPEVNALRGLLEIGRGSLKNGEHLLRSSVSQIGDTRLRAELQLRLAIYQSNNGLDPQDLLRCIIDDEAVDKTVRLEARAYLAYVHAFRGREAAAVPLAAEVEAELANVTDQDVVARLLLRLGNVKFVLRQCEEGKAYLVRAAEIAGKRGQWGTAARANQTLVNLVLFHENDTASSLWYAQQASASATRAGDYMEMQRALLMMLTLETRRGNSDRVVQIEQQIVELSRNDNSVGSYLLSSQAHRAAWAERFSDAHRMFGSIRGRQHFAADRAFVYAAYALCLSLDRQKSADAVEEALKELDRAKDSATVVWAIGGFFVVLAELVSGRTTSARQLIGRFASDSHEVVRCARAAASELIAFCRNGSHELDEFERHVEAIVGFGFGGYARYFRSAVSAISSADVSETAVRLTPSELRILQFLARGMTPKEIAIDMDRSVLTVQTHVQNVIKKLGGHGRAEAIATARRAGLL